MAGCVLAFARALGEFGATAMLAGDHPEETRTLALAVYALTEQPGGTASAATLVGISVVIIVCLGGLRTPGVAQACSEQRGMVNHLFQMRSSIDSLGFELRVKLHANDSVIGLMGLPGAAKVRCFWLWQVCWNPITPSFDSKSNNSPMPANGCHLGVETSDWSPRMHCSFPT